MILLFNVDEQTVSRTDSNSGLVNESVDYLSLSFTFKSNSVWDNLDKKIEFYANGTGVYDVELDDGSVTVPFEVLTGDYFIFSLYGVDGDLRVTTNKMKIYLDESGFIGDGVAPGDDKRTVIEQINDRVDGVVVDVDALESTVSGHTTALSTLSDDVTGLAGSVSALSTNVNAIDDDVDSLESTVGSHTNSINSLTGSVSALSTTVNAIGDDVDSLETIVTGHTNSLDGLARDVDSIGDDITTINGKLDNTIEMTVEYSDGTSESFDVVVK